MIHLISFFEKSFFILNLKNSLKMKLFNQINSLTLIWMTTKPLKVASFFTSDYVHDFLLSDKLSHDFFIKELCHFNLKLNSLSSDVALIIHFSHFFC